MPGPAGFLRDLRHSLACGCVVVALPPHAPCGLRDALRSLVTAEGAISWVEVPKEDLALAPASALAFRLGLSSTPSGPTAPLELGRELNCSTVWVEPEDLAQTQAWLDFVRSLARSGRSEPAGSLGSVVLCAKATEVSRIEDDAGLEVLRWRGRVGPTDSLLWVHDLLGDDTSLSGQLRGAIALELGSFDLGLVEALARAPLGRLLDPVPLLLELSRPLPSTPGDPWATGAEDLWLGTRRSQACFLAAGEDVNEIQRLLWRAELSVVFPAVESKRLGIVGQLRSWLTGADEDLADLEIGKVCHLLRINQAPRARRVVPEALNELRKAMAHLEPVRAADLVQAGLVDATEFSEPRLRTG